VITDPTAIPEWCIDQAAASVEHLPFPRCRFVFEQDVAGAWWCVQTVWIDDPFGDSARDVQTALALANELMRQARTELVRASRPQARHLDV
jgi:hypothetical protein